MVKKKRGVFSKEDEQAFETYAIYCGLALHHAKLYDKIRRSEQKYNVALEVLSYYNTCDEDEFESVRAAGVPGPDLVVGIDEYVCLCYKNHISCLLFLLSYKTAKGTRDILLSNRKIQPISAV